MRRGTLHRTVAIVLGALLTGATYWLDIDPLLSAALGVALAANVLMLLRVRREFPDRQTGDGWRDGRWTALSIGVTNFAALLGLLSVPFPDGYRAAAGVLVILIGFAGYTGGSLAEMERDRTRSERAGGDSVSADD